MATIIFETGQVTIPEWVEDLESFRRWSDDDAVPEKGRIAFLKGDVWVDMSMEQLFDHNDVKGEINMMLRALVKSQKLESHAPPILLLLTWMPTTGRFVAPVMGVPVPVPVS